VAAGTDFRTCFDCGESTRYEDDPVRESAPAKKAPAKATKKD
jgi:hypothetical protein